MAPAGVSDEVIAFYEEAFRLTMEDPEYLEAAASFATDYKNAADTAALIQMILAARKFGVESGVDTVFAGFKPVQFLVTLAMVIVYFFLMKYIGFFVSTTVFMLACLLFLRVPILATILSIVSIDLLIYLAFVLFLGVRLPAGILF